MTVPTRPSARCRALLLELSRYLDGDLTPARRRTIERHIEGVRAAGRWPDACGRRWRPVARPVRSGCPAQ